MTYSERDLRGTNVMTRMPFGLQFELIEPSEPIFDFVYNVETGISWIDTPSGLQPYIQWSWLAQTSTGTRNNDEDVERPPTTTATKTIEPNY